MNIKKNLQVNEITWAVRCLVTEATGTEKFSPPFFFNTVTKLGFEQVFSIRPCSQRRSAHIPVTQRNFTSALWVGSAPGVSCLCAPHRGDPQCHQGIRHVNREICSTTFFWRADFCTSCSWYKCNTHILQTMMLGEVVVDTMLGVIQLTLSQCFGKSTFFACLFGIKSTLFGVLYSSQLA